MLLHFHDWCFNSYLDLEKKMRGLFSCDDDHFLFVIIAAVWSVFSVFTVFAHDHAARIEIM